MAGSDPALRIDFIEAVLTHFLKESGWDGGNDDAIADTVEALRQAVQFPELPPTDTPALPS